MVKNIILIDGLGRGGGGALNGQQYPGNPNTKQTPDYGLSRSGFAVMSRV